MDKTNETTLEEQVSTNLQRLNWMFENIDSNPLLAASLKRSFSACIKGAVREIEQQTATAITREIDEGMLKYSEEVFAEILDMMQWGADVFSEIESSFINNCYEWCYRERFPRLYSDYLQSYSQEALLTKDAANNSRLKTRVLLALYGHSIFLQDTPVILRVVRPHTVGECSKKGKKPELPQEDRAFFCYNGKELLNGTTSKALVFNDGIFQFLDTSHTRARLVKKKGLAQRAIARGIYTSRGVSLPVEGVQPFWQSVFVKHIVARLDSAVEWARDRYPEIDFEGMQESFHICIRRFIADRMTAEEYWRDLQEVPQFKKILEALSTQRALYSHEQAIGTEQYVAFKMMTIF